MSILGREHAVPAASPRSDFGLQIVANFLDIRSLWSIDHEPDAIGVEAEPCRLLAFANAETLKRLRSCEYLHREDVQFLVVIDGDAFASAWGPCRLSGSLARWAWRQSSSQEAYYDESRWAGEAGAVIRIRRKAFLLWRQIGEAQARESVYKG